MPTNIRAGMAAVLLLGLTAYILSRPSLWLMMACGAVGFAAMSLDASKGRGKR